VCVFICVWFSLRLYVWFSSRLLASKDEQVMKEEREGEGGRERVRERERAKRRDRERERARERARARERERERERPLRSTLLHISCVPHVFACWLVYSLFFIYISSS
jgi:hypothetical protein